MILRTEDFKCEASIPGLLPESDLASPMNEVVRETVEGYIEKYEPQFIRDFGMSQEEYDNMDEFASNDEQQQNDDEMKGRLNLIRFSLSHYVAFHYFRVQTNALIGGVALQSENGSRVSLERTLVLLWNQMVSNNKELHNRIYGDNEPDTEIFKEINIWNI